MTERKFSKPDFINLNNKIRFRVGNICSEKPLGAYYQDFHEALQNFETQQFGDFDSNGLPRCGYDAEAYYHVIYIIQYGLIQYDLFLNTNHIEHEKKFIQCADWIFENAKPFHADAVCWPSVKPNKKYNLNEGWISGMYQGQAISLLLRAFERTNHQKYFELSEKAFSFFKYNIQEGGCMTTDVNGDLWLEEFPSEKTSYVLNGFIYAMFGVYDFWRVTKSTDAKNLFDACILTLKHNLKLYDCWYWSLYDKLKKELISPYYMINIHVNLLRILYLLTNEKLFDNYASKWERNYHSGFNRMILFAMMRIKPRLQKWLP